MNKTIGQALIDEIHIPMPFGYIENVCIKRGLTCESEFNYEVCTSSSYKGALADCLSSLLQSVSFSESDKSIGSLSDAQINAIVSRANKLYDEIGEERIQVSQPTVFINC